MLPLIILKIKYLKLKKNYLLLLKHKTIMRIDFKLINKYNLLYVI